MVNCKIRKVKTYFRSIVFLIEMDYIIVNGRFFEEY